MELAGFDSHGVFMLVRGWLESFGKGLGFGDFLGFVFGFFFCYCCFSFFHPFFFIGVQVSASGSKHGYDGRVLGYGITLLNFLPIFLLLCSNIYLDIL